MKYLIPLLALGLLCGCGDKKEPAPSKSSNSNDSSTASIDVAEDDDLPDSLGDLVKEFETKMADLQEKRENANSDEERYEVFRQMPKGDAYAIKAWKLLDGVTDESERLEGLLFATRHGREDGVNIKAAELLIKEFPNEERIANVCVAFALSSKPKPAEEVLTKIADTSSSKTVQGVALFALAQNFKKYFPDDPGRVGAIYERIANEHESLTYDGVDVMEGVKQALKSMGSALALSVGKMAPEIAGPDIDGVDFNLSDYRGKVVMLDFWGDW